MITLSKAFKLCKISNSESVYLKAANDKYNLEHYFWSGKLIETIDMKKIKVVGIEVLLDYEGVYTGFLFTVRGATSEELSKLSYKCWGKGIFEI